MPEFAALVVELLTEELPPRSLALLAKTFGDGLCDHLSDSALLEAEAAEHQVFATPRRLATLFPRVLAVQPDRDVTRKGPAASSGLDAQGMPTKALLGFAKSCGVPVGSLVRDSDGKTEYFFFRTKTKGETLQALLPGIVEKSLSALPAPKLMRWGAGDAQFVRPVHGLMMLHGERVVAGEVLGQKSGRITRGHRFMGKAVVELASASEYRERLRAEGMVIADFGERRAEIERQLKQEAARQQTSLGEYQGLLDEVTALVEHPSVYVGTFEPRFLEVPQECLILTMRQNQKYFPLFDSAEKLTSKFLIVSNMRAPDPHQIIAGNERVVRPRLEDARFFFNQDRRSRLEARVPPLAGMVFHNRLGSQLERVERIQLLAGSIARALGADVALAERAAWLSKADLLSGMVGEFPQLQGVMGRHYALLDGEPGKVADAIEAHYRPRFAGDSLPADPIAASVALADKLDTLVGIFGVGLAPTGDKDPFGLRRQALGVLRILIEQSLPLDFRELLATAYSGFGTLPSGGGAKAAVLEGTCNIVYEFTLERLRSYLREREFAQDEIDAVVSQNPARFDLVLPRLIAVRAFRQLPEAESLAAANKRIRNILKKAGGGAPEPVQADLVEPAERELYRAVQALAPEIRLAIERQAYGDALKRLAGVRAAVDAFFDSVLVMAEDPKLRENRIALLRELDALMNQVADISRLAA